MLRFVYNQLPSTNDQAKLLIADHPSQTLLVTANTQTAGRGRSGQAWQSPHGGAWFSIAHPTKLEPSRYAPASVLAGWTVLQTIQQTTDRGLPLTLKWPNDVLADNQKIAGVLCEMALPPAPPSSTPPTLIIGVGINANFAPDQLGHDLRTPATTLQHHTGRTTDLPTLITQCAEQIQQHISQLEQQGFTEEIRLAIEPHLAWLNKPIALRQGQTTITGTCQGLDDHARLLLKKDNRLTAYDAGQVEQITEAAV